MDRPRFVRYLYNRWVFLLIGLMGLGNIALLLYRFFVLGVLNYAPSTYWPACSALLPACSPSGIFVDLSFEEPGQRQTIDGDVVGGR